ncbi:RNA polymerase sigma factor [Bremerella sp.]|uniref:RNA polymerase sigma factor n=1 Tax=Bremerella sp. TaxID=2795602 RepID=UPI00391CBA73
MPLPPSATKTVSDAQDVASKTESAFVQYDRVQTAEEDALLIQALQSNDREALGTFVQRQQGFVFGYLRSRMVDPTDADDLCQEVFLRCLAGKVRFRGDVPVRPWLLGVARNVLREHIRRNKRRKEVEWTELCLELDTLTEDESSDYRVVHGWLHSCIETLGSSAHEALKMHYFSRLKMAQIAEKMRRSEGAVKLLVFRARQALKECVTRKSRTSPDE